MESYSDLPIGIDLGTTYSCIGVYRDYRVEIIPNERGDRTTPSIVCFLENGELVGEQTEYCRLDNPKNKIYAIKRIIGRDFDDKEVQEDISNFTFTVIKGKKNRPQIEVNNKKFSPEEISAKILSKLKKSAELFLNQKINKVVITVPAYFTERQKQATKNAGKIAGLNVIKIINEPTAASLAYGFGKENDQKFENISKYYSRTIYEDEEAKIVLVFDLGGGTLDVTLLELEKGDITVKQHSGRMHLGGEDFDNLLVNFCIDWFKTKTSIDLDEEKYTKQKLRLKDHCTAAKIELSFSNEVEIEVESIAENKDFYYKLSRAKFEDICKEKFEECLIPINEVLEKAQIKKEEIDEVLLVGGSSKIPKIQNLLSECFDEEKLNKSLNPDEVVAYGATIQAALQMGQFDEDVVLSDVCPFSLGIACYHSFDKKEKVMDKIITKGTRLPFEATKTFYTNRDNQESILIEVFEGENRSIKDNYPLGQFRLSNLPKKEKGKVEIEVTFKLNEDSILSVFACEKQNKSNKKNFVVKNDKGGLTEQEIENAKESQEELSEGERKDSLCEMSESVNYKGEISRLSNLVNYSKSKDDKYIYLQNYQNMIVNYINNFVKDIDEENFTLKRKLFFYLKLLFNAYSCSLTYTDLLLESERNEIISSINKYLKYFEKNGISFSLTLIEIFKNNDDIFYNFFVKILGYYSSKATDYYLNNEKKYAKHFLEEGLLQYEKYNIETKIKDNFVLQEECNPIIENIKELINIVKSENIEKYCKSFSKDELIKEDEFKTEEEKINILDRFKDALRYVKFPKKKEDKLLKAIYLANIVKIEFKILEYINYDVLLKMSNESIDLKVKVPRGCCAPEQPWFKEICDLKIEIEKKQKEYQENPDAKEVEIKEKNKKIFELIDTKFKEGTIKFIYFILKKLPPIGLYREYNFKDYKTLETAYNSDKKKFIKDIRKLYNPLRYKTQKNEEEVKRYFVVQEISMKLNKLE